MANLFQNLLRTYALAYFIPSFIFVAVNLYVLIPSILNQYMVLNVINFHSKGQIYLTILFTAFTGFSLMCSRNHLFNFFEGYYFNKFLIFIFSPLKMIQKVKREKYVKKIIAINQKIEKADSKIMKQYLMQQLLNIKAELLMYYPYDREELLPTSFGNIFRAFESYPTIRYGIDSIIIWPRLINVIPSDFSDSLEKANNSIVFFLVSSTFAFIFGSEYLAIGISKFHLPINSYYYFIFSALFFILSYSFYRMSLKAALNFGEVYKSCFDLFRSNLIESFGINFRLSLKEERKFWEKLRQFIIAGDGDPFTKYQNRE